MSNNTESVYQEPEAIKRTPGKWSFQGPKKQTELGDQIYFSLITDDPQREGGKWVWPGFFYPHSAQSIEEMEANAKYICEAVNNYPRVVKENEEIKIQLAILNEKFKILLGKYEEYVNEASSILKGVTRKK